MVSGIILTLTITVVFILLYRKISDVRNFLFNEVGMVLQKILNPREAAMAIGTGAAKIIAKKIGAMVGKRVDA
ncbi:MAG: hypothetical protein RLZZ455_763 [Candidatus Parcubacteria bacterium]